MKNVRQYLIVAVLAILAYKWIETNPFSQLVNTGAQSQVYYTQAQLQQAQAEQIQQAVRRQNEQDNGLGMNMNARIIQGKCITDLECLAAGVTPIAFVLIAAIFMAIGALVLAVLVKLTATTVTRV